MSTNLDEITTLTSLRWFAGLSCGQSTMLYTYKIFFFVLNSVGSSVIFDRNVLRCFFFFFTSLEWSETW